MFQHKGYYSPREIIIRLHIIEIELRWKTLAWTLYNILLIFNFLSRLLEYWIYLHHNHLWKISKMCKKFSIPYMYMGGGGTPLPSLTHSPDLYHHLMWLQKFYDSCAREAKILHLTFQMSFSSFILRPALPQIISQCVNQAVSQGFKTGIIFSLT
jgi:hypothetical protein